MAIQTSSNLSNSISTRYLQKYQEAARVRRLYDQLAGNIASDTRYNLETRKGLGSTYTIPFLSDMAPGTAAISESADVTPQILVDAVNTITPTSRGEALKWAELVDLSVFTNYVAQRAQAVGDNAMETIENLAIAAALQGSLVIRGEARASLNAGTTADLWTEAAMWKANSIMKGLKAPAFVDGSGQKSWMAIAHDDAFYDLFHGGNVVSALIYGGLNGNILLTGEVGSIANFKLVISPWAKVFGGAGADNSSGSSQTYVLSSAAAALDKTLAVTTGTNVIYGRLLTVGIEETANTFYDTNERVRWISGTTTATIVGSGANGGVRFGHPVTTTYVLNADSVYPVAYGGPRSLAKVFASDVGEFGEMVGPLNDGMLNQFQSLGWKFYGGYGRIAENMILRGEYASSLDS